MRRRELIRVGWPHGAIVNENTSDAYIARLRRKLRGFPTRPSSRRCTASATRSGEPAARRAALRTRLLLLIVLGVGAALAVGTVGFNLLIDRSLSNDADEIVEARAAVQSGPRSR